MSIDILHTNRYHDGDIPIVIIYILYIYSIDIPLVFHRYSIDIFRYHHRCSIDIPQIFHICILEYLYSIDIDIPIGVFTILSHLPWIPCAVARRGSPRRSWGHLRGTRRGTMRCVASLCGAFHHGRPRHCMADAGCGRYHARKMPGKCHEIERRAQFLQKWSWSTMIFFGVMPEFGQSHRSLSLIFVCQWCVSFRISIQLGYQFGGEQPEWCIL